jgi:hypothetical protein
MVGSPDLIYAIFWFPEDDNSNIMQDVILKFITTVELRNTDFVTIICVLSENKQHGKGDVNLLPGFNTIIDEPLTACFIVRDINMSHKYVTNIYLC